MYWNHGQHGVTSVTVRARKEHVSMVCDISSRAVETGCSWTGFTRLTPNTLKDLLLKLITWTRRFDLSSNRVFWTQQGTVENRQLQWILTRGDKCCLLEWLGPRTGFQVISFDKTCQYKPSGLCFMVSNLLVCLFVFVWWTFCRTPPSTISDRRLHVGQWSHTVVREGRGGWGIALTSDKSWAWRQRFQFMWRSDMGFGTSEGTENFDPIFKSLIYAGGNFFY